MARIQCDFFSDTLGLSMSMNVILPQATRGRIGMTGKLAGRADRSGYPTLWLLHGLSDDHTTWGRRTSIERYAESYGLAVVMPAVHRSFYADMAQGPDYWTYVSEELPTIARGLFPLSDRRADNFVAGLSMGGYGAFKHALLHPDRYAAAASLSGALHVAAMRQREDREDDPEFTRIFGPLDKIPGSGHDLRTLADRLSETGEDCPALYQCCGTEDFLYPQNLIFRDHANKLGLPLTYAEHEGRVHEWGYWDQRIRDVLAWLPLGGSEKKSRRG